MNIDSFFSEIMGKEQLSKTDFVALGLDSLFVDAARFVINKHNYHNLYLQNEFKIDYAYAEKLFRELRDYNVIGSAETTPRRIMSQEDFQKLLLTLKRKRICIASEEDLLTSKEDDFGVKYSYDGKRLLKAPEDIKDYSVKESTIIICDRAFANTSLTSVDIPEGTEIIGSYCFWYCQKLASVILPNSLREIGGCCFGQCAKLTSLFVPKNVERIGRQVFAWCNNLHSVVVDENNPYYDSRDNCNAIIESFSNTLYAACSSSVIPKSVIKIGDNSFNYCERISTITIPGNVAEIGHQAFYGCNNLKDVVFQEGVREIGHYAFMEVNSLKTITLPSSLRTIGEGAFERCDIDTIFIPEGVEVILGNPFKGNNPKHIFVSEGNRYYDSRNGCNAIIQSHNNVLIAGCRSTIIPSSVTMIGEVAFDGCSGLTTIVVPEGVKKIASHAFSNCEGNSFLSQKNENSLLFDLLKNEQCEGLTSIYIPNSIERAWGVVFGAASNLKIMIPKGTKEKFEKIFMDFYKDKLVEQD